MARKTVALLALAAFSLFEWSCVSPIRGRSGDIEAAPVMKKPDELGAKTSGLSIVSVVLKSGATVEFDKGPAHVAQTGDAVAGMADQELDLLRSDVKTFHKDGQGKVFGIETLNGRTYRVEAISESGDSLHISAFGPITIPFSDIQQLWVKRTGRRRSSALLLIAGAGLAAVMLMFVLGTARKEPDPDAGQGWIDSCPFVYSWNGEEYVLDAEPYGGAFSEGLKRTDWIEMSGLRADRGEYRVLLTNELDETQCTDELKLVVVDHAPGVRVAPGLDGRINSFSGLLPPSSALDQNGRDIGAFVSAGDRAFWLSPIEGRDPDAEGDFRDELTFEFPKPAGAKRARLLANVWSSPWAAMSGRGFLELHGSSLEMWYEDIDRHGPEYTRAMNWLMGEEVTGLKVLVETPDGWEARASIAGGAPFVAKDKAYLLDIGDVPGEVLRIKLRPPVNFWMVDSLAVDYGEEPPVRVTELAPRTAADQSGRDVRGALERTDGSYLTSPMSGDWTEIVFAAPPLPDGLARTVLVKASGYYRIHVDPRGEPQDALLGRVLEEPGFAVRYAFREYLKWAEGLKAKGPGAFSR